MPIVWEFIIKMRLLSCCILLFLKQIYLTVQSQTGREGKPVLLNGVYVFV